MNNQKIDFALLGHQESWDKVSELLHMMRFKKNGELTMQEIKDTYKWIPPRTVFRIKARSIFQNKTVTGVYIDSFIPPDHLGPKFLSTNISRVKEAALYAQKENAKIATLGGFTSIVIEGKTNLLQENNKVAFTTGNTLTTAYICKAIESACKIKKLDMMSSTLLIIGSTGDVGSGCLINLYNKFGKVLLCARNGKKLLKQKESLADHEKKVVYHTEVNRLIPKANVIISAASLNAAEFTLEDCLNDAIICDAGYPRNIRQSTRKLKNITVFHGGMGYIEAGIKCNPDILKAYYKYPIKNVGHGCFLEAILLAFENRTDSFSNGRGNISIEKTEEIWQLAQKHGFGLSPFFNNNGLIKEFKDE